MAGFEKRYHGVVSAFMFATETQQTIGKAPLKQSCKHCRPMQFLSVNPSCPNPCHMLMLTSQ